MGAVLRSRLSRPPTRPTVKDFRKLFRLPWRDRDRVRADVDGEIEFHLEMRTNELVSRGMSPEAARAEAERQFGDLDSARRILGSKDLSFERKRQLGQAIEDAARDLRYGIRRLARAPGFTAIAVLTLAIGIGANAAIFDAVSALLLRPISGVSEPNRVVEVAQTTNGQGLSNSSYLDFVDLRDQVSAFDALTAYVLHVFSVSRGDRGERALGIHVTPEYFDVMGVSPLVGRFFLPEDDLPGAAASVVVLSYDFWQARLGGDPDVVGSTLIVNRTPFRVVGVAPQDFRGHIVAFQPDVYLPLHTGVALGTFDAAELDTRAWSALQLAGRLAPGVSLEEAGAQVATVHARLAEAHPDSNRGRSGVVLPLGLVPGEARTAVSAFFSVLEAMVVLILLVTCANLAGMLIARNAARDKEMAVRMSLGCGRGRLVRQLVIEALVVFAAGGAIGTGLGLWLLGQLPIDVLPTPFPARIDLSPDPWVLVLASVLTMGTGAVFGLIPALQATAPDVASSLKSDGSGRTRAGRLRRFFVTAQVGISLVLLVSAGLFLRALDRVSTVDVGFEAAGVFKTGLNLEIEGYGVDEGMAVQAQIVDRIASLPGVEAVALANDLPLDLARQGTTVVPEGWEGPDGQDRLGADYNCVSPEYFGTLEIRLFEGRTFQATDAPGSEPVAIVSRAFAERAWPGESALGHRVRFFQSIAEGFGESRTIVGVVDDVKSQLVTDAARPAIYAPLGQVYRPETAVVVRAGGSLASVSALIEEAVLAIDGSLSMEPVVSMEDYTALGILPQRVAAAITTGLGVIALLLAALGVYGVVAFAVGRRTREIGLRMALGADRGSVVRLVVRGELTLVLPGLVLGSMAAIGAGYLLRFLLLGVSPTDPAALAGVAAILLAVVGTASFIPAKRASGIDPVKALRSE